MFRIRRSGINGYSPWGDATIGLSKRPLFVKTLIRVAGTEGYIERNDNQFTWRGGVNYLFDNGISPYFSYSQSFEPSAFDLGSNLRVSYKPSKGEQYEAGVKYVPNDMPVVVTGAVYQSDENK